MTNTDQPPSDVYYDSPCILCGSRHRCRRIELPITVLYAGETIGFAEIMLCVDCRDAYRAIEIVHENKLREFFSRRPTNQQGAKHAGAQPEEG